MTDHDTDPRYPTPAPVARMLYVAIIDDRHADTEAHLFTTPDAAVAFARAQVAESATDPDDVEEETIAGWLYYARWSPEGDSAWVVERPVDEPAEGTVAP